MGDKTGRVAASEAAATQLMKDFRHAFMGTLVTKGTQERTQPKLIKIIHRTSEENLLPKILSKSKNPEKSG